MNLLLNTPPLNVYEHMALDEIIVKFRPAEISLRFFHWDGTTAVTYGYAQPYKDVLRTLPQNFSGFMTRRPTGGGVVFHRDDLTFSLVFQHPGKPVDIYQNLHAQIVRSLIEKGEKGISLEGSVAKEAYRPSQNHLANACFINPVENDVLAADGHKILGGALRRFGTTVLYQGSLQIPGARTVPLFKQAVIEAVRVFLAVDLKPSAVASSLVQSSRTLAQECYQTTAWKEKF
ncbi:MAG: hypothetical protein J5601_03795 [Elusimicrobiaceae bacterium]|nr:hypothetical protein [Elusimicrobiaceae bacterium]